MGSHNLRLLAIAALVLSVCLHGADCGSSAATTHDTPTATDTGHTTDAHATTATDDHATGAHAHACYGPCAF